MFRGAVFFRSRCMSSYIQTLMLHAHKCVLQLEDTQGANSCACWLQQTCHCLIRWWVQLSNIITSSSTGLCAAWLLNWFSSNKLKLMLFKNVSWEWEAKRDTVDCMRRQQEPCSRRKLHNATVNFNPYISNAIISTHGHTLLTYLIYYLITYIYTHIITYLFLLTYLFTAHYCIQQPYVWYNN